MAEIERRTGLTRKTVRDEGHHGESRALYASLLQRLPDNPVIRCNALVGIEYDPAVGDAERFAQARAWGEWAILLAGGPHPRLFRHHRPGLHGRIRAWC